MLVAQKKHICLVVGLQYQHFLPAGCRKDISAGEGGELPKIDFANPLNNPILC